MKRIDIIPHEKELKEIDLKTGKIIERDMNKLERKKFEESIEAHKRVNKNLHKIYKNIIKLSSL